MQDGVSEVPLVREYLHAHSHDADELRHAMARHGGNQSRAAQALGLTVRQFSYRWKRVEAQKSQ
jgi:Nif-specific regulatory protein